MDIDGIGVAYLYPSLITSLIAAINSAAFASALVHAYNDWLLEYCSVDLHRLRPVALVPQQDLVLAVEEMGRMVSKGVNAIMLRPNPVLGMTISHPNYERVWSAAEEMGVVIGIHEGLGVHWAVPEAGVDRCRTVMQAHIVSHPVEHMLACLMLVTDGVLERYPHLRVGFMESGARWAPFWLNRMDEHWEKGLMGRTTPERPSFYFKRQCFLGVEPDDHLMSQMVDFGLGDAWSSSDFPHFDAIYPGSTATLLDRDDLGDSLKRKILHDNAVRMYGERTVAIAKLER